MPFHILGFGPVQNKLDWTADFPEVLLWSNALSKLSWWLLSANIPHQYWELRKLPGSISLGVFPQTFHRAERKTLVFEGFDVKQVESSFLSPRKHHLGFRKPSWMLLMLIIFNIIVIYLVCIVILHKSFIWSWFVVAPSCCTVSLWTLGTS